MTFAAVHSKAVILFMFIHCLLMLLLCVGSFCVGSLFSGVVLIDLSSLSLTIILLRKRKLVALL